MFKKMITIALIIITKLIGDLIFYIIKSKFPLE